MTRLSLHLAIASALAWICTTHASHSNERPPLPPGYKQPQVPTFDLPSPYLYDATACTSCQGDASRLILFELDKVVHEVDVDTYATQWTDDLLTVFNGQPRVWQPERFIMFYPKGINKETDGAAVVLNNNLIKFTHGDGPEAQSILRSTTHPSTTLTRVDGFLVLDYRPDRRYYLESVDGGVNWRLARIEWTQHKAFDTKLVYEGAQLHQIIYPDGKRTTFAYQDDLVTEIRLPNTQVIKLGWDDNSRLESIEIFDTAVNAEQGFRIRQSEWVRESGVARYIWHEAPKVPGGLVAKYVYMNDAKGRIKRFVNACGTEFTVDYLQYTTEEGEFIDSIVRNLATGQFEFMRHKRYQGTWLLTRGIGKAGQSLSDATILSEQGYKTAGGRWVTTFQSNPLKNFRIVYKYDQKLRLKESVSGETPTVYVYEGNRVTVTHPSGRTSAIERDDAGRIVSQIDISGRTTTFQYDDIGRQIQRDMPATGEVSLTETKYDDRGFPFRVTVGGRTWLYYWDALGRMDGMVRPDGIRVDYKYDDQGRLRRTEAYEIGQNPDNAPTNKHVTEIHYDWHGNLRRIMSPTSFSTAEYECGRIAEFTDSGQKTIFSYDEYGRLALKNIVDKRQERFKYDDLHRPIAHGIKLRDDWVVTAFGYDKEGNRHVVPPIGVNMAP